MWCILIHSDAEKITPRVELYIRFSQWWSDNEPFNKKKIGEKLFSKEFELFGVLTDRGREKGDTNKKQLCFGVRLRTNEDDDNEGLGSWAVIKGQSHISPIEKREEIPIEVMQKTVKLTDQVTKTIGAAEPEISQSELLQTVVDVLENSNDLIGDLDNDNFNNIVADIVIQEVEKQFNVSLSPNKIVQTIRKVLSSRDTTFYKVYWDRRRPTAYSQRGDDNDN